VGLPRSGTTIVNNILHSCDNCISISELHWLFKTNYHIDFHDDTWKPPARKDHSRIINSFFEWLKTKQSSYEFGGVKETARSWEPESAELLLDADPDLIIMTLRDPRYIFNSWLYQAQHNSWSFEYSSIDYFISNYLCMISLIEEYNHLDHCKVIIYDNMTDHPYGPLAYLNERLSPYMNIGGPLKIKPCRFTYGDLRANHPTRRLPEDKTVSDNNIRFKKTQESTGMIPVKSKRLISKHCVPLFKQLQAQDKDWE
jgi:hypothetical protein